MDQEGKRMQTANNELRRKINGVDHERKMAETKIADVDLELQMQAEKRSN